MLYFLMETALGGDLYSVYVKNALHGNLPARLIISPKLMWNMKIDVSEEGPSANQGKRTPSISNRGVDAITKDQNAMHTSIPPW